MSSLPVSLVSRNHMLPTQPASFSAMRCDTKYAVNARHSTHTRTKHAYCCRQITRVSFNSLSFLGCSHQYSVLHTPNKVPSRGSVDLHWLTSYPVHYGRTMHADPWLSHTDPENKGQRSKVHSLFPNGISLLRKSTSLIGYPSSSTNSFQSHLIQASNRSSLNTNCSN